MPKPWFYRLLLSYLPIFFFTTSVLILLIFLSISQFTKNEAKKANETYALHVMQSVDYALQSIDEYVIKELQTDPRIEQFYDNRFNGNPYYAAYEVTGKIREIVNYNKFIDSVYFYRDSNQIVISPNTMVTIDRFGDGPFIEEMMADSAMYRLTEQRIYTEFLESDQRKQVVSIVRKVPLLSGQKGLIVVNIGTNAIQKMVGDMSNSRVSFIDIYDSDGKLLLPSKSGKLNGEGLSHRGTQLTKLVSPYTEWEYRSGLNDENMFGIATVASFVWIGLGIIIVVLGSVWITYVTRRNYRPIESIMLRIRDYSGNKPMLPEVKKQDEFQFIERALGNLMELSSHYEKQHEEDNVLRRRHFFKEWLEGGRGLSEAEWTSETERLKLTFRYRHLCLCVVEIDKYVEVCRLFNSRDQDLLKFVLVRVTQEIAEQEGVSIWAEWTANHRLSAVIFVDEERKNSEKLASVLCENVRAWVESHLHFRVTIGVGHVVGSITELIHSYDAAVNVLRYKSAIGSNRVIYYWESEVSAETEMYKHLPNVKSMAQYFRIGDNLWKRELGNIFAELKSGLFAREEIISLINYMTFHLYREMMELTADFQELWKQEALPRLNDAVEQFDTLEELYTTLFMLLDNVADRMCSLREERTVHSLMKEIRTYVEDNYADAEMSLTLLGRQFNLSTTYLSRVFKEEFGEKFVDHLVKVRMEQAKRLLDTTRHSVQDIAAKVGYTHAISFIRAFKKYAGVTPGEYRKEE